MYSICKTILRGTVMTLFVLVLSMTAQAASSPSSGARDEVTPGTGSQIKDIEPGLKQVKRDADKIPEKKVEETDKNLEKELRNQPKMTTDPAVKEYNRMN